MGAAACERRWGAFNVKHMPFNTSADHGAHRKLRVEDLFKRRRIWQLL
jgi:hypothetical protein